MDQRLCLLAAAAENERVSAFEPHDHIFASLFDQKGVYRRLAKGMIAAFLADVDTFGAGRGEFEQFLIGQVIENDHLGLLEDFLSPDRQKTGVPRSGPHEIDFAFFHCDFLSTIDLRPSIFFAPWIEQFHGDSFPECDRIFQGRSAHGPEQLPAVERSDKTREFDNFSGKARMAANGDLAAALEFLEQTAFGPDR